MTSEGEDRSVRMDESNYTPARESGSKYQLLMELGDRKSVV